MIKWKKYISHFPYPSLADGSPPTDLVHGCPYLVCTDNAKIMVRKWLGRDGGGFRTSGLYHDLRDRDSNVLYYAEINYPELFSDRPKSGIEAILLENIKLREKIKRLEEANNDITHLQPQQQTQDL